MKSLQTLIISGCSKINKLEEDVEQMESLAVLKADNTAIEQVPIKALARLKNLVYISVFGYEGKAHDVIQLFMSSSWNSPTNVLSSPMQKRSSSYELRKDNSHCNKYGLEKLPKTIVYIRKPFLELFSTVWQRFINR
ncbi:hypothetical protein PIB30_084251 [Stylosanthes scabra]|uniref:Uncharacterized protein n=1 Tax=Stylosanthes scabra TaxID=79078 RepID=A0ABU6VQZ5_9FABA|nr:hypothetical protein [Stylosanthes scabra]